MNFDNKTVLITGAAGNLGRAVAQAFADDGARLALVGRRTDSLRQAFGDENAQRLFVAADLMLPEQVSAAVGTVVERYGRIDVLCNLAGGFRMGDAVHDTPDATWDFLFDLNVRTVLHMAHAVVPHMIERGGGKIVNVSAFAARQGSARMGAYAASKSAVVRLTETMAAELRERHINVNCVLPTTLDTPENRAAMPEADPARWVAPRDLAGVIAFLASDAACAIHGAALPVTGLG
jgi:NAD(P)-dependent dehydrogenase (short-subunit alcohol dehydrogenase family)